MQRSAPTALTALIAAAALVAAGCSGDTETLAPRSSAAAQSASTAIASAGKSAGTSPTSVAGQASSSVAPSDAATGGGSSTVTQPTATHPTVTQPGSTEPAGSATGTGPPPDDPTTDLPPTVAGLPDGWPPEVRLPPGAENYPDAGGDAGRTIAFRAPGSPADLAGFFDAELIAAGYARAGGSDADGAVTATYTRDGSTVDITVVAGEGASVGMVTITP